MDILKAESFYTTMKRNIKLLKLSFENEEDLYELLKMEKAFYEWGQLPIDIIYKRSLGIMLLDLPYSMYMKYLNCLTGTGKISINALIGDALIINY